MPPPSVPLDAIRQPAVLYDADGRIVAANDMAEALADRPLAGLSAADLAGIFDVRSPDGAPFTDAGPTLSRALAGEEVVDLPLAVTLADGRTLEILATASPVRDGDTVTGALVLWQDVTARVTAERALRESEERVPGRDQRLAGDRAPAGRGRNRADHQRDLCENSGPAGCRARRCEHLGDDALRGGGIPAGPLQRGSPFRAALAVRGGPGRRAVDTVVEPIASGAGEVSRIAVISRNITDRKQAEEALRESEERLRSIFDRSLDALDRRDLLKGPVEDDSPAIEAISGFSVEECLAMDADEILARVHPDDRPSVVSGKMEVAPGREEGTVDYRFLCKDGTYRWFSDRFRIDRDEDGRPLCWEGIIRDIDDRRLAEEALRESEEKYRALIETNADFVWEVDTAGRYTYCSPQMMTLWGINPEEMIGRTPFDRMPPGEREPVLAAFAELARSQGGFSGLETVSYDGRGNLIALEISGLPFFGDDGAHLGYRGVTRDVTERVRAGEALRESEERLRLAQEGAGIGIWDRDAATNRVTVAPGFIQRYLLDPEAMATYADWEQFIHPDDRDRVEAGRLEALAAGEPLDLEFRIVIPPGEVRWVQLRGRGMADGGGDLVRVVGVIIDVTERRRAEEALVESEADARSFFANMVDACAICEVVVDRRGEPVDLRLVEVNPAFEQALSLPARLIVGQTAFMILPTLHREWLDLFLEVSRDRTFVAVEEPFPALGRRYHVTGFPVRNGRVAVVFRDITGQRQA